MRVNFYLWFLLWGVSDGQVGWLGWAKIRGVQKGEWTDGLVYFTAGKMGEEGGNTLGSGKGEANTSNCGQQRRRHSRYYSMASFCKS